MVEVELQPTQIVLHARIILYGTAASAPLASRVAHEIETLWNEPVFFVERNSSKRRVVFQLQGIEDVNLSDVDVLGNTDPRNNYFRVEEHIDGGASFVDGIPSNTGYFRLGQLAHGSTTAAHEFGHTIGLFHPPVLDIRGYGRPGIMYPRGTITDPAFQYDPAAIARAPGGTMNPIHRRVSPSDIDALALDQITLNAAGRGILGWFTSVWHNAHETN
jgi:hypothetical protein